jgi:spore germination cell wall hydrolase CwlJ-like protein
MRTILLLVVGFWLTFLCGFGGVEIEPAVTLPNQPAFTIPAPKQVSPHDVRCLTEAIYHEARGEPVEGQRAVGEVVLNRRDAGFARTVCGVVYQKDQFSWSRHAHPVRDRAAYARANELAFGLLAGYEARTHRKFLYFFSGHAPVWAEKMNRKVRIRNHMFLW